LSRLWSALIDDGTLPPKSLVVKTISPERCTQLFLAIPTVELQ
jgi:hypothetical protein